MESHTNIESSTGAAKPSGPVAAVMLSAGIGAFFLGLFTVLSEASEGVHTFLEFNEGVGPLSGKTTLAVFAFAISWIVLGFGLRDREVDLKKALTGTVVLFAIAVIMTFPTFFLAFAPE